MRSVFMEDINLIPSTLSTSPNYWCTWGIQNFSLSDVTDMASWNGPIQNLNERLLFEEPGWAAHFFEPIRQDLYILFDAGWDVPIDIDGDKERWQLGSLLPDKGRFPSCKGSPAEQLHRLNELSREHGWRGAGLWVAPQVPGDGKEGNAVTPIQQAESYWRERLRWSRQAGIEYWKVDTGHFGVDSHYRQMLTRLAREEAPELVLEHAPVSGPFNDVAVPWSDSPSTNSGRYRSPDGTFQRAVDFLCYSDILRIYDVTSQLSIATSLERLAQLFTAGWTEPPAKGLINCEDEPYLAAGLGCTTGILRHPLWLPRDGQDYNPAQLHLRIDEDTRLVRWQRLAPAFGVNESEIIIDENILFDRWLFHPGDSWAWWVVGQEIRQGAPARVARGMPLPIVAANEDVPFVVASRNPNGAMAVATLPRTLTDHGIFLPLADVSIEIGNGTAPVGIFGKYCSLTLLLSIPIGSRRIWAQDLAGEQAVDITNRFSPEDRQITLCGEWIDQLGTAAATPGDISHPGLLLFLKED